MNPTPLNIEIRPMKRKSGHFYFYCLGFPSCFPVLFSSLVLPLFGAPLLFATIFITVTHFLLSLHALQQLETSFVLVWAM